FGGSSRGPLAVTLPFPFAGVEHIGLGQPGLLVPRSFEEVVEEFGLHIPLVLQGNGVPKIVVANHIADLVPSPGPMVPWAKDQGVVIALVVPLYVLIGLQGAMQVLGIEPT